MYLLPNTEKQYKANLHTHSTISDGELTSEELKEKYKAQGKGDLTSILKEKGSVFLEMSKGFFLFSPHYF